MANRNIIKEMVMKYGGKKLVYDFNSLKREMKLRGYSKRTQDIYLHYNEKFLLFCKKKPLEVTNNDIKDYIEYLIDKNLARATIRLAFNSLRFYYGVILGKSLMVNMKAPKKSQKITQILTKEEISRLISVIKNPKHRLLVELCYASGVRVSELVKFKVKDILFEEKIAIVRGGKGRKDRKVILSQRFLDDFQYELMNKNQEDYLFSGRVGYLTTRSVQAILKTSAKKANIKKNVHPHMLRHSFATHLVNDKVGIKYIQKILGHKNIKTTERYLHVSDEDIKSVTSPHDKLEVL
jgi:integrase/recombinase XerD